jgi:hypothetical protein
MIPRLEALSLAQSPVLSQIALGVSNEVFVSNKLLPAITVTNDAGKYPIFPSDALVPDSNLERPFKSDKIQKKPMSDFSYGEYLLQEYALGADIDRDEVEAASAIVALDAYYMQVIMESLYLNQEYNNISLLTTTGNYASGNTSALTGTDCWDHSSSKPLTQLQDAILTVKGKASVKPNTLLLGEASFNALKAHADLKEVIKYSQKALVTEDLISELLSTRDNPVEVVVGSGIYYNPLTSAYVDLWGDVAILAYVPKTAASKRSKYEPAFGYTFTKKGYPYGGQQAGDFDLIKTIGGFIKYQSKIVKNSAGFLFTNTKGS